MANHGLSSEQARQIGAKTLWIGDIEPWMDEQYIMGLFNKYAVVQQVKLIRDKLKGSPVGYGFVEFPNHEIAKNVFMTLNGTQIQGTQRNYKLNWASHGTSRHHQNQGDAPPGGAPGGGGGMQRQGSMGPGGPPGMNAPKLGGPPNMYGGAPPVGGEPGMGFQGPPGAGPGQGEAPRGGAPAGGNNDAQVYVGNLDPNVNNQMLLAAFKKQFPSCFDAKIIMDPVTKNSKGFGFIKFGSTEAAQQCIDGMQGTYILSRQIRLGYAAQKRQPGENRGGPGAPQTSQGGGQFNQPQQQPYFGGQAGGAPQSSYYNGGSYAAGGAQGMSGGVPPPPPAFDYYGNPIQGQMGGMPPYYQQPGLPNQPNSFGGPPQHQQPMYGGHPPPHQYQMYGGMAPGYDQPWMAGQMPPPGGLPAQGSQGPNGFQGAYGTQPPPMGQPGSTQQPIGGMPPGQGPPPYGQGPRPYGAEMYDQPIPGQEDRQGQPNRQMMPGSDPNYPQPMMNEMPPPMGQQQPPHGMPVEGDYQAQQHLGNQVGPNDHQLDNGGASIVKAPLLQDDKDHLPQQNLLGQSVNGEQLAGDQPPQRNEADADVNKIDTDTSDQQKQQALEPNKLLGSHNGQSQQQQHPHQQQQQYLQDQMQQQHMMQQHQRGPPQNFYGHPQQGYMGQYGMMPPNMMHPGPNGMPGGHMMNPGQPAGGPVNKPKQQRSGLVRLSETQVDELNKQFLNEVFEDPEVLYLV